MALGPRTTQRGVGEGSLVNGKKFSFWKEKESSDSTLQLEGSEKIEKDETKLSKLVSYKLPVNHIMYQFND